MTDSGHGHRHGPLLGILVLITATGACVPSGPVAAAKPEGGAPAAVTTIEIRLHGPVDRVFALFDPRHRSSWDADWEIELQTPGDRRSSRAGDRFHRTSEPESIWTVTSLDPTAHVIELAYEKPKLYDMHVRIQCGATAPDTTTATVTYRGTGKSEHVHEALTGQLTHQIEALLRGEEGWERKINHYLEHGTRLAVFAPLAVERSHTIEFDVPPAVVFELMNPAEGNHWTPTTPDYVFGSAEGPDGAMWRVGDGWMVVADYDRTELSMKTVLYLPDTEFMIEDARCTPAANGGTTLTVSWRVAGISEAGNAAVRGFFDRHWDMRMSLIERSYRDRLDDR